MKLYDITQEMFSSVVYPGDPAPKGEQVKWIAKGDVCNLTFLTQCAHNGTHMDAPRHFVDGGKGIDEIPLEVCVGDAYVLDCNGIFTAEDAAKIPAGCVRLLLRGGVPDVGGAQAVVKAGVRLIGVEHQSVGGDGNTAAVHKILLGAEIAVLEGIRLAAVPAGEYFLFAAPINYGGIDGAPVRAVLTEK